MVRILHLEDNVLDARLIRYALEDEGIACDIKVVDTKAAFIESLEQESFDLIFADFSLPTFNAIDALGWVRERGIRTPVLLISGVIGEEFAVKSLKAGATDYVLKDHLARLAPAVRRTLAEYQQRRKQLDAEAEIQRQSELFGLVEKMVQLGTFTWEADGAGLYWSPGLYAIYEWGDRSAPPTLDALMGPVHPQDRPLLAEALSSAREQGGSLPISFRLQLSDQRTKYIFCQLEAPSQAAGPRRVVGVMQDVTRTKQTENALQRSERNFRRLSEDLERRVQERTRELHDSNASLQLEIEERRRIEAQLNNIHESIDDVIWSFSVEEGRVNYLSPSATRLFGLTAEQVEGLKTLQDLECLVYPEDRDKVVQAFLEGNAEKGWDFGFRLVNQSDESIHMVRVRAKQSVDERGGLRFDGITTDISERVRAEKRLKASEHRYRTLFDSAPDAIISMDIQSGNIIAVNHKAVELLGRSESHLRAMAFAEVFAPAARAAVMDAFGAYIGGASFRLPAGVLPLRLAAAGGQLIPVEVSPSKFWLGDRQVLSCFFRDVRERLEQEEAIRDLQEKYRLISENTLDILLLFTPDGALQYASPSLAEVLGSPVEAFLGKNILEQYSPQAGRQAWIRRAAIEPLLAGEKGQTSLILPVFDARGDLRLFDVQTRPIRDTDGKVQYLLSRCRDVTDRERAYQQVKEREAQYRLISENMSDLITINTLRGKLIWVSPSVQEVLGCAPEDILGLKALTFVHPEDRRRLEREMRRLIRREVDMPIISYRLRHQSGDYRWVETSAKGIFDEAGQLQNIQTSTRDISERKQAEEETRRALARERELNELKSHFVSVASHQFRTPLTVIQSNMQLLRSQIRKKQGPAYDKLLDRVEKETRRLTTLMNDVLIMGRLDANRLKPHRETVDAVAVVQSLVQEQFAGETDGRQALLQVEGVPRSLEVDPKLFEHTLSNLLSNAFKYSPGAQAPVVTLIFHPHKLEVQVRDFGIGIPEEDQAHLFQSFFRARNTRAFQGTGLGLAIALEFTKLNDGSLFFVSKEGEGATFFLELPLPSPKEVPPFVPNPQDESVQKVSAQQERGE